MKKPYYLIGFIVSAIILEIYIVSNFEYFGRTDTGGGFFAYGFGVWIGYIKIILLAISVLVCIKMVLRDRVYIKKVSLFFLILSTMIWYVNKALFLGGPLSHIAQGDFDNDGLPNWYEDKVGTSKYSYCSKGHTYVLDEIVPIGKWSTVEKVIVKIIGEEDYSNVRATDTMARYAEGVISPIGIEVSNFGHYLPGKGVKFDYIEVEIHMGSVQAFKDYRPAIYIKDTDRELILEEVNYLAYENQNRYIVKFSFDDYMREDIYRYNDDIIFGMKLLR